MFNKGYKFKNHLVLSGTRRKGWIYPLPTPSLSLLIIFDSSPSVHFTSKGRLFI